MIEQQIKPQLTIPRVFVGIEIDKEYFEKALNRIEQYTRQGTLSFKVADNGWVYVLYA